MVADGMMAADAPGSADPDIAAYRDLFYAAGIGISEADLATGLIIRANPHLCEMLGYAAENLVGEISFFDITHPEDRGMNLDEHRRLMAGEIRSYTIEKRYMRKDGRIIWGRVFAALTRGADGRPVSSIAVIEEITAQKRTEARLRLAMEVGEVGPWEWDISTGRIRSTPAHSRLYGIHVEEDREIAYEEWISMLHPDDRESVKAAIERAKATGSYSDEFRVVWPDGTIRWLSARARCEVDAGGRPTRMIGMNADITSQIAGETLRSAPGNHDRHEFADGATIIWQGDPAAYIFQVMSGTVKIFRILPDGRSQILGFEHAGNILGFPNEAEYTYCAEALGKVVVRRFPATAIEGLRAQPGSLLHRIAAGALSGLGEAQDHVTLLGVTSARERLLRFLVTLPEVREAAGNETGWMLLPMSRQDIADYLALRRETVSRVLTALKQEGLIDLEDRRLRLVDLDRIRGELGTTPL